MAGAPIPRKPIVPLLVLAPNPMFNLRVLAAIAAIAATPSPAATPTACPPNSDAIVKNAMSPDYPNGARDLGLGPTTVVVDVTVSAAGDVRGVTIAQSSGIASIDVASMEAAVRSVYSPKIVSCKAVPGHYLFRAEFNPN